MGKRSREEVDYGDKNSSETNFIASDTSPLHCPFCFVVIYGYNGFQNHFLTFHEHQCITCEKIFPSRYILDLHIDEYHNPFLQLQRGNKDDKRCALRCFSENCKTMFASSDARVDHLVSHHNYPKTYPFGITSQGISPSTINN
ncbi:unnamed protein product [Candida parapsilosis]|uniref:C2H2-type domain-containing protein n=1 Tax=Candida parapsilosis (strain CDC 317 / ATCC MYA-4646) TaxID=578454 RepID=G8B5H2_CANPC|nr:uncharacterized protein CPAR2_602830 [Candida parapsilosis]CCE39864.1 hypothetical protein CPAR2_602830 [Candida parapsilosis]